MHSIDESSPTPAEAVQTYVDRIQRQFSCVASAVVDVRDGYYVSPHPHVLAAADGNAIRLLGASRVGFMELQQVLRLLIEEFQVAPLRNDWDDMLR